MDWETWQRMPEVERAKIRTPPTPHDLDGCLGWRVEVVDRDNRTRRFIVGVSTGWRPIYLEIARRTSHGGPGADSRGYKSVRKLYKVR